VTDRLTGERLREAFQALGEDSASEVPDADLDLIWRAAAGELPAAERLALVDRMAADPALAEAWRLAHAIQHPEAGSHRAAATPGEPRPGRSWWSWFAPTPRLAFAAVLAAVAAAALVYQLRQPPADEFRDATAGAVLSLVPPDAPLGRETFHLRWTPGPEGSRYHVRVTTEDLRVLADTADLTAPEFTVGPDTLSALKAGERVLWQVELTRPDGVRISSRTFVQEVR
jgi:hypothetical protein